MSGILDNKSRVLDAILTFEGRKQMADGNFVVKYVSFSDRSIVYQLDNDEGHVDPTKKIYLEAFNSPNDQITFEADDSGRLSPFRRSAAFGPQTITDGVKSTTSWQAFSQGKLVSRLSNVAIAGSFTGSFSESGISGSLFASQIEGILTSSLDSYKNLFVLGSADNLFEDYNFALSKNDIEFTIQQDAATLHTAVPTSVNTIDALFSDEKLRNVINFRYLPPIKKSSYDVDKKNIPGLIQKGLMLGDYPSWGPLEPFTFTKLQQELKNYPFQTVKFDPTSRDNEIIGQFFEIRNDEVRKLDVINYGRVNNDAQNPKAVTNHVFFVGKVYTDEAGADSFVHMFTLVFEPDEE